MDLKEFLLDALFPPRCLICGSSKGDEIKKQSICESCISLITTNQTFFCIKCRARLAGNARVCHMNTPLRLAAVGSYDDPRLQSLITQLKYQRRTSAVSALAVLTRHYLKSLAYDFDDYLIAPIPLHAKRQRQRGFNQSLLIARELADQLQIPLIPHVIQKMKSTKAQAETKNLAERTSNLLGCFAVNQPETVRGKQIILVDDVCTSGATLSEAAETLKSAGAKNIIGFVMAKTR